MRQMRHEVISSRSNPLVTRLRKLGSKRSARREEGVFVGEGPKLLQEAVHWRIPLETVVYASGVTLPQLPDDVRVVEVPDSLLEAVAQTQTPQGVVFVCRTPALELPEQLTGNRYLILDGVQDPGNVGTIWRTADAFGADGLILCSGCADPWSPKTVRATMGAVFRLPFLYVDDLPGAVSELKEEDIRVFAAHLEGKRDYDKEDYSGGTAFLIGNEGNGLRDEVAECADCRIRIPMQGRAESLNAAVAAAVLMFEAGRQRRQ